ncbi:MAG: outer-membrane lipoprotein carrier protein LolA [Alphaproteobacteria bacterium]|nr:outer-membrane lipoprotein carrier protein LolA [Alphaproteobacteria bacterium]
MKKLAVFFALAGCFWSFNAQAQTSADLKAIEDYLNNIKTLEADFVQTASNGNTTEGRLFIAKPNKIRMEYAAPTNVLIVGDGSYIVYNDKDLDQVTHIDYDDIPASLILANDIKIDGKKFKVKDFYKDAGTISATLEYAQNKEIGPITLIFSNNPLELKQWKIIDPQSVEITVSLYDAVRDGNLDGGLFKFKKDSSPLKKKGKRK